MRLKDVESSDFVKKTKQQNGGMRFVPTVLGGDPEFFVASKEEGRILPSDKFFPGKDKPIVLPDNRTLSENNNWKNKIFFDGIQGEVNPAAQRCREYLNSNIRQLLKEAVTRIGPENKLVLKPSVRVLKKVLEEADPEARIFGCMPDFNAYTLTTNTCEMDASKHFYRYAGGHIHLGKSSDYLMKNDPESLMVSEEQNHLRIIKFMDLMVGVLSVIFDRGKDAQRRRTKYGLAGCFRPTPYGVEYRTPSCWWMRSPITSSLVYGFARMGWMMVLNNFDETFRELIGADDDTVRGICDESDVKSAKKLWENMRPYIALFGKPYWNPAHAKNYDFMTRVSAEQADREYHHIMDHGTPSSEGLESKKVITSLAALDYLIENGLDTIIGDDVETEWGINNSLFNSLNGFITGTKTKLSNSEDFHKFQQSYYAQVV